jgi:hypothetical protein
MNTTKLSLYAAGLMACGSLPLTGSAAELLAPEAPPPYRPLMIDFEAGTTGLGGALSWRFADHFGVRAGFNYFEYSDSGLAIKDLKYDASVRVMSEPLTLNIFPWEKSSFYISVGVQFNQNRLSGSAEDGGTVVPPEKLGVLSLNVEQQPVNPYLSIGGNLFYFDHAHHWALGGELGVAYTGSPDVSLTRSGPPSPFLDAATRYEQQQVEKYAENFTWWPVLKLSVTYSF